MSGFSLKPTVFVEDKSDWEYKIPDVKFKRIIVDADALVFNAANSMQELYVIITHTPSGKKKEFPNKTAFHGHWKKREGGWLADENAKRVEKGKAPMSIDDFEIEELVRLSPATKTHLQDAMRVFDSSVGSIKRTVEAEDYLLCIGGKGNFRFDVAHILAYKGNRLAKPLLFQEVKEAVLEKYKKYIEIVDGEEADDRLGQYGWANYQRFKKTGVWEDVLAYVDKDLDMIASPSFNFSATTPVLKSTDMKQAAKCFCAQLLSGDKSVDNIGGLENLAPETIKKYGLRNGRGVGKATALSFLEPAETVKEMFERVVEAYRDYYGDDYTFVSHRGEEMQYTWLDVLQENAILLYMRKKKDEMYDIRTTLNQLGIKYE